ncbi:hypothetical protein XELAEV_18012554mg [Xenopus laevis]|uniref:Secreted protein n=1 Tax=Xenopus laevis TaxID=8355 RepID=A0A974DPQ8_XENLA|nr:hypothetical protein XELAEV_18012554mg [Xenopus laevis]
MLVPTFDMSCLYLIFFCQITCLLQLLCSQSSPNVLHFNLQPKLQSKSFLSAFTDTIFSFPCKLSCQFVGGIKYFMQI